MAVLPGGGLGQQMVSFKELHPEPGPELCNKGRDHLFLIAVLGSGK